MPAYGASPSSAWKTVVASILSLTKSVPLPEDTGISRKKSSELAPTGIVMDCSTEPASNAGMPPNHVQKLPVRGPVPPPKPQANGSQIGVPKFVDASVQNGLGVPASKLPSVMKSVLQAEPSPE